MLSKKDVKLRFVIDSYFEFIFVVDYVVMEYMKYFGFCFNEVRV